MSTINGLAVTETAIPGSNADDHDKAADHHHNLNAGQIVGIIIGATTLLVILGVLIYFCGRKGGLEKGYRKGGYIGKRDLPTRSGESSEMTDTTNIAPSVNYASPPVSPYDPLSTPGTSPLAPAQVHYHQYVSPQDRKTFRCKESLTKTENLDNSCRSRRDKRSFKLRPLFPSNCRRHPTQEIHHCPIIRTMRVTLFPGRRTKSQRIDQVRKNSACSGSRQTNRLTPR